jgi:hypothetical protein
MALSRGPVGAIPAVKAVGTKLSRVTLYPGAWAKLDAHAKVNARSARVIPAGRRRPPFRGLQILVPRGEKEIDRGFNDGLACSGVFALIVSLGGTRRASVGCCATRSWK